MAGDIFNTELDDYFSFENSYYFQFLERFGAFDTDGDGAISAQESQSTVATFDKDRSGSVEIWEMAQAMKRRGMFLSCAGSSPIFDPKKIDQWKKALQFVTRQGIAKADQGAAAGITPYFEDMGFTPEQIAKITKTISSRLDEVRKKPDSFVKNPSERRKREAEFFSESAKYAQKLQEIEYHPEYITELLVRCAMTCIDYYLMPYFLGEVLDTAQKLHEKSFTPAEGTFVFGSFVALPSYLRNFEALPQLLEKFRQDGVTPFEATELAVSFLKRNDCDVLSLPATLSALRAQGFEKTRALRFLKDLTSLGKHLRDLPNVVNAMGAIGFDPIKIEVVLIQLTKANESYYNSQGIFKDLSQLLIELDQAGLTPDAISDLVVELSQYERFWEAYPHLPRATVAFLARGENADVTSQYLMWVAAVTRGNLDLVFQYLPEVMSALENESMDHPGIRSTVGKFIAELKRDAGMGLKLFVDLKKLGFSVPRLMNFITAIHNVAYGPALEHCSEAAGVLHSAGYTTEETQVILMEVATQLHRNAGNAFGLFQDLKDLGCDPERLPQFFMSLEKKNYPYDEERFEHLKDAATVLAQGGFRGDVIMEKLASLSNVLQGTTSTGFSLFKTLAESGVRPEHIPELLTHIASKAGENTFDALKHLPKAVSALAKTAMHSSELVDFLKELATTLEEHTGNGCRLLGFSSDAVAPGDFPNLKANVIYLSNAMNGKLDVLLDLLRFGNFDPKAMVRNRVALANTLATTINGIFAKKLSLEELRTASQRAAVVINYLHDRDRSDDLIRKTVTTRLSNRAIYFITALGGSDLYTSTFINCFYEMRILNNRAFLDDVRNEIDPQSEHLTNFILTLGSFRRFWPVFTMDPDYFTEKLFQLMATRDGEELIKNTSLLLTVFKSLLEEEATAHLKPRFEQFFLEGYESAKKNKDRVRQAVYGFVVKHEVYGKLFTDSRGVKKIHEEMPPLLPPRVPDAWLRDRTLRAKLYFYPDELKHFRLAEAMYREKGFSVTREDQGKTIRMKKRVNGITLEVIATLERSNISRAMADPTIDILAHRGHSYHLKETLPSCQGCSDHQKLLYLGSCGSFRNIGDLMKSYAGNYFISDEDAGRGADNNTTLATLMEAIAVGERDWDRIREYVAKRYDLSQRGLIFPTDRSMLLYEYVRRFHNANK